MKEVESGGPVAPSFGLVRTAEDRAVAEHRDGTVLAHGDHGRERVVVAVAAARSVASAAERLDGLLGLLARHEPHAEEMTDIAEAFGLHELAVADMINAGQRAKLEQFGEIQFLVLRSARSDRT